MRFSNVHELKLTDKTRMMTLIATFVMFQLFMKNWLIQIWVEDISVDTLKKVHKHVRFPYMILTWYQNVAYSTDFAGLCPFPSNTVDGSEIPNNHLGCIKPL